MTIRFQADADLNQVIVLSLIRKDPQIDFQTAHVAELAGKTDREVLAFAADAGRILVTHDHRTMPQHFGEFIAKHTSPGIIVVPQALPPSIAAENLLLIWHASTSEEWTNRVAYLPI